MDIFHGLIGLVIITSTLICVYLVIRKAKLSIFARLGRLLTITSVLICVSVLIKKSKKKLSFYAFVQVVNRLLTQLLTYSTKRF